MSEQLWNRSWTPLGPQPINSKSSWKSVSGRVTAIAVNPTNRNDVWIGTAAGGVWNSTNGGHTWKPMTDQQPTQAIGSLAIDPNDANTIYAGTGEANLNGDAYWGIGVLKSTDHGATWQNYGNNIFGGLGIGKIAIDPTDSQVLLLSTVVVNIPGPNGLNNSPNTGIWRSDNGGITWQHVLAKPITTGTDVVFDPADPAIAFAALATNFALVTKATRKATDAGVYKSTDCGKTWKLLSKGIPTGSTANIIRISLGISSNGEHVYALVVGPKANLLHKSIYVSENTGGKWRAKAFPKDGSQWFYDIYVAVDPTDSTGDTVYVGAINIWKTTDGGENGVKSWTNLTHSFPPVGSVHPDQHALTFFSNTSSSYYLGCDGGIWSGTATGKFTNLNAGGLNITQFYSGSIGQIGRHAQLYGGTQDNGENQYPVGTPSTATRWKEVFGGDGGDTVVDYTNNAVVYEEYVFLAIYKSTNGGKNWTPATKGIKLGKPRRPKANFIAPFIISPSNHKELFAGTDRLYITTNGAKKWKPLGSAPDPGVPINAIAVAPSNDNYVYVGDNYGNVFRMIRPEDDWRNISIPGSTGGVVRGLAVDPTDPNIVYVSFSNFASGAGQHVFKSIDGGINWIDISTSLPNIPFSSILIFSANGQQNILVGSDIGVFETSNGGLSWTRFGSGLPNVPIDQIFTDLSGTKIFVATHGRGMWELANP
jgi:photosystem II stability/assembly factor-like uncharacterized protein